MHSFHLTGKIILMILILAIFGGTFLPVSSVGQGALAQQAEDPSALPYKTFLPMVRRSPNPPPVTPPPTGGTTPPPGPDFMIMSRSKLQALSNSSSAWNAVKAAADSDPGNPNMCNQDSRIHPKVTFASALVYSRTGDRYYYERAKYLVTTAYPSQIDNCPNAILALGRQLAGYVIAADLIGLQDAGFNNWLSGIRNKNIGGHTTYTVLRNTAYETANNWGIYALASIIAADRFLGDWANLENDWRVFASYGVPHGWAFSKTWSYNEQWSCVGTDGSGLLPIAINTSCTKDGYNLDGAPVEDSSRTVFPTVEYYPTESAQGLTIQALLLAQAGYPAWTINDSQIKRLAEFRGRFNNLNLSSTDYYVTWITNKMYGLGQPTKPASFGRSFGFTDWLFAP